MDFASYQKLIEQNKKGGDENVCARFYDKAVKTEQTSRNGMPVFKTVCYCEIRIRDNTTEIYDQPADEDKKKRFPIEYARYQLSKKQAENGTPLEQFAFLTAAEIETCRYRGILTIEKLSELTTEQATKLGVSDVVSKAKLFIEGNSKIKKIMDAVQTEKALKAEIKLLKDENAKLKQKLKGRKKA